MRPPPPRYGAAVTGVGSSCSSASGNDHRRCWCPPAPVYSVQQYSSLKRRPSVIDHNNRSPENKQQQQQEQSWHPQHPRVIPQQQQPLARSPRAFCLHCERCRQQMNDAHYNVRPPNSTLIANAAARSNNQRLTSIPQPPTSSSSSPMPGSHSPIDCWWPHHAPTYNGMLILFGPSRSLRVVRYTSTLVIRAEKYYSNDDCVASMVFFLFLLVPERLVAFLFELFRAPSFLLLLRKALSWTR